MHSGFLDSLGPDPLWSVPQPVFLQAFRQEDMTPQHPSSLRPTDLAMWPAHRQRSYSGSGVALWEAQLTD